MSFNPPPSAARGGQTPASQPSARVFKNPPGAHAQDEEQRRKRRLMLLWLIAGLLAAGTLGYGLMNRNKGVNPGAIAAGGAAAPSGGGGVVVGEPIIAGPMEEARQVASATPRQTRATVKPKAGPRQTPVREDRAAGHPPPPSDPTQELVFDPPGAGEAPLLALLDDGNNDPLGGGGGGGGSPQDGPGIPGGDDNFARRASPSNTFSPGIINGGGGNGGNGNTGGNGNGNGNSGGNTSPIPEPETYAMMLAGLAVIGWQARRRKRQR